MRSGHGIVLVMLIWGLGCGDVPVTPGRRGEPEMAEWSYSGREGPAHWGQLDARFSLCARGVRQSPIDLVAKPQSNLPDPQLDWRSSRLHLINNGHTIEVALTEVQSLTLDSVSFELSQFHFHTPSEHSIEGQEFPLEVHFVFASGDRLAVLGVLVQEGVENPELARFWGDLPGNPGEQGYLSAQIDPLALLPFVRDQYRYAGSLTAPPCTEGVQWVVYRQPLEMSAQQIDTISQILGKNRRPRQNREARSLTLDLADKQ